MLRQEIVESVNRRSVEDFKKDIFDGFQSGEAEEEALLTSLLSDSNLLTIYPPGSCKTTNTQ